jgi:hypothetical protein
MYKRFLKEAREALGKDASLEHVIQSANCMYSAYMFQNKLEKLFNGDKHGRTGHIGVYDVLHKIYNSSILA